MYASRMLSHRTLSHHMDGCVVGEIFRRILDEASADDGDKSEGNRAVEHHLEGVRICLEGY